MYKVLVAVEIVSVCIPIPMWGKI